MDRNTDLGHRGEEAAASFLEKQGFVIKEKNYRCRMGEIDLIGLDGEYLVVVEVKTRRGTGYGTAAEAVDHRKQAKIGTAFRFYCHKNAIPEYMPVRFDVVEVNGKGQCRWIRNAFEFTG